MIARRRALATASALAVTVAASLFAGAGPAAAAAVVHVDAKSVGGRCSDSRSLAEAASPATPWCSLAKAVASVPAGGEVVLRRGDYGRLEIVGQRWTDWVTFRPAAGEKVTLKDAFLVEDSANVRLRGLRVRSTGFISTILLSDRVEVVDGDFTDYGMIIRASSDVTVAGNLIHDLKRPPGAESFPGYGIWANGLYAANDPRNGLDRLVVRDNVFRNIPQDGIQIGGGQPNVHDLRIEGNEFDRIVHRVETDHSDGIQLMGANGAVIAGNYFHDSDNAMLIKDDRTDGLVIANNLAVGADAGGHLLQVFDAPGARIVNNTLWNDTSAPWPQALLIRSMFFPPKGTVLRNNIINRYGVEDPAWVSDQDYNLILNGPRRGRHDSDASPRFTGVFQLAPGSPGIDAGDVQQAPGADRLGHPRQDDPKVADSGSGHVDVGAAERQVTVTQTRAPAEESGGLSSAGPVGPLAAGGLLCLIAGLGALLFVRRRRAA